VSSEQSLQVPLSPTVRVLAALAGVAAAAAVLIFGGLYAVFSTCTDYAEDVCGSLRALVGLLAILVTIQQPTVT